MTTTNGTETERISWTLEAGCARLRFECDSPGEITTTLPIAATAEACLRADAPYGIVESPGFSPYTAGNRDVAVRAAVFLWQNALELTFVATDSGAGE